jgi:DNA invertase Pin-like site-specific DNA recombinase
LIGYARVSSNEQELNLQTDALLTRGVAKEHLYCDRIPGRAKIAQVWRRVTKSLDAKIRFTRNCFVGSFVT